MLLEAIINLKDYTIPEHILFATGCIGWVISYAIIIRSVFKGHFVEIPVVCICANVAWEFTWSFLFQTNMGELYVWGYRIWFFMDCFIVYGMFRYGYKQMRVEYLKKNFIPLIILCLACWGVSLYFYIQKWDYPVTHMGANSGYILNVFMSLLYPLLLLGRSTTQGFSYAVAWLKGVGTGLISIFCFLKFPDHHWLLSLCVITGVLDAWYIIVFSRMRKLNP